MQEVIWTLYHLLQLSKQTTENNEYGKHVIKFGIPWAIYGRIRSFAKKYLRFIHNHWPHIPLPFHLFWLSVSVEGVEVEVNQELQWMTKKHYLDCNNVLQKFQIIYRIQYVGVIKLLTSWFLFFLSFQTFFEFLHDIGANKTKLL